MYVLNIFLQDLECSSSDHIFFDFNLLIAVSAVSTMLHGPYHFPICRHRHDLCADHVTLWLLRSFLSSSALTLDGPEATEACGPPIILQPHSELGRI